MFKRLCALLLAGGLAICLFGCPPAEEKKKEETKPTTPKKTEAEKPKPTPE